MVSAKGKRKLVYKGNIYYWYVKLHGGVPKVHILSEDKKTQLCCNSFDTEVPVSPEYVAHLMEEHLRQCGLALGEDE